MGNRVGIGILRVGTIVVATALIALVIVFRPLPATTAVAALQSESVIGPPTATAAAVVPSPSESVPTSADTPLDSVPVATATEQPAWTADDVPMPTGGAAEAGDANDTQLTPAQALDDAKGLVTANVIGARPVVRFLSTELHPGDWEESWVIVSDDVPAQPDFGSVAQGTQETYAATYGWAFISPDGGQLLAEVFHSWGADTVPSPMPLPAN